ncbi:MAG TPA: MinD/ParA family protein [Mycobacteriales bacterium]|nr:MinD/ParA family protein [Mycobacteriales bacterium]
MSTDQNSSGDQGRPYGPVAVPHRRDGDQPAGWQSEQQWSGEEQQQDGAVAWEGEETAWGGQGGWQQEPEPAGWQSEQQWNGEEHQQWQGGQQNWQQQDQWQQPQPAPQETTVRPNLEPPPGLNDASLLTHRKPVSARGWRRAVSAMTFGAVKPGLSPAELAEAQQLRDIRTPIRGCHRIGVVSLKGGIGKTTTAAGLGLALATSRGDGVISVDANPDAGTLADRLVGSAPSPYSGAEWVGAHVRANDDVWIAPRSVRDLLAAVAADEIGSATDVMRYVSIAGRLHVLASEQDPETSEAFSAHEYRTTAEVISAFYSVMITDTGTGLLHSAMAGMLSVANSLVIIAAPSVDGASRAAKTLDWLDAHHYGHLVSRAVVAVSHTRPRAQNVDIKVLDQHFGSRCRDVVHIPYDPHLVAGAVIRWDEMAPATRSAFLRLAASVALDFRESWNSENPADDMR